MASSEGGQSCAVPLGPAKVDCALPSSDLGSPVGRLPPYLDITIVSADLYEARAFFFFSFLAELAISACRGTWRIAAPEGRTRDQSPRKGKASDIPSGLGHNMPAVLSLKKKKKKSLPTNLIVIVLRVCSEWGSGGSFQWASSGSAVGEKCFQCSSIASQVSVTCITQSVYQCIQKAQLNDLLIC